ncbi:MAG: YARHG domain-containing protein [Sporocytophaga sp.]|nr:YARHG domain-containing protein [Sporocytophaga sp.]
MNKLLTTYLIIFLLTGCSVEKKETAVEKTVKNTPEETLQPEDNTQANNPEPVNPKPIHYEALDSSIQQYIPKLDSLYGCAPYFTKVGNKILFYVARGKWKDLYNWKINNDNILLGIVDQDFNTVLAPEYSKIYNPDATAQGYIEIEIKGKRGLLNYSNGKIIQPEYEVIFPSDKKDYIAIGKKGNEHYAILSEGNKKNIINIPTYIKLGEKWTFDIESKNIKPLFNSYKTHHKGDPLEGNGVVFTPSYLYNLGYLPEIVEGIGYEDNLDFGLTSSKGKITESLSISDKIYAFISSYYEEGVDVRGWEIQKRNLITVDSKNNVLGNQYLLDESTHSYCGAGSFKFIRNNLLELKTTEAPGDKFPAYQEMPFYTYYEIGKDGKITKLESPRFFDFTKFVVMNEDYVRGCYYNYRRDVISEDDEESESEGNLWVYDHLSIEDLDLMRNEIFAEYGLKFKNEKWQKYFSKQSWYAPKYENVDPFLSDIDKQNINFILTLKEKMAGKEKAIINKRLVNYVPAG